MATEQTPGSAAEAVVDALGSALVKAFTSGEEDALRLWARVPRAPVTAAAFDVPAEVEGVAAGRRFLRTVLVEWGHGDLAETACLLASELLANAVCHACGPLRLRMRRAADELTVDVCDGSRVPPQARSVAADEESGRGLLLVDSLASDWGTRPTPHGKTVWFSLPTGRHQD